MASLEHISSIARRMLESGAFQTQILNAIQTLGFRTPQTAQCSHTPVRILGYSEPEPIKPTCRLTALIDGSVRMPDGPAGYGVLIRCSCGVCLASISRAVPFATSSQVECLACLAALKWAAARKAQSLTVITDFQPLAMHIQGKANVRAQTLRPLLDVAQALALQIPDFTIKRWRRGAVRAAHLLARQAVREAIKAELCCNLDSR